MIYNYLLDNVQFKSRFRSFICQSTSSTQVLQILLCIVLTLRNQSRPNLASWRVCHPITRMPRQFLAQHETIEDRCIKINTFAIET